MTSGAQKTEPAFPCKLTPSSSTRASPSQTDTQQISVPWIMISPASPLTETQVRLSHLGMTFRTLAVSAQAALQGHHLEAFISKTHVRWLLILKDAVGGVVGQEKMDPKARHSIIRAQIPTELYELGRRSGPKGLRAA